MRADLRLVEQGLAPDLQQAQRVIMAGAVLAEGSPVPHPASQVAREAQLQLRPQPRYVGRGGEKLAHALATFSLPVNDGIFADIGAFTGGFTDCLLQHGASRVYAIDAGRGQLAERLRSDERVVSLERTNARHIESLPEPVDGVVMDVAFISVTATIPNALRWLRPDGWLLVLLKPQFELELRLAPGGVVTQPAHHALALGRFLRWCLQRRLRLGGLVASPLKGDKGNREFFFLLRPSPTSQARGHA